MPIVFMHCGRHKTGTTAKQFVCATHRPVLLEHGVFYPPSGAHYGHHNLAWEIIADPRFNPNGITWRSTIGAIVRFPGNSVLSSEDFESLLHRPEILAPIVEALQAAGREVCIVIYVREQARYIESLYLELLKHGYPTSFNEYHDEITRTGFLTFGSCVYQFDLERVLTRLRTIPGLKIVMRRYDEPPAQSAVPDFLSVIGLPPNALGAAARRRYNPRCSMDDSLRQYMKNNLYRECLLQERAIISRIVPSTSVSWSIGDPAVNRSENATQFFLGRVFSQPTIDMICQIAASRGARNAAAQLAAWWQGRTAAEAAAV